MRQSITTKYLGPTDHRDARVKARASGGLSLTLDWDPAWDFEANSTRAARALAAKYGWSGRWIAGGTREGNVYVQDDGDGFVIKKGAKT